MFSGRRLHDIWVGERLSGVIFWRSFWPGFSLFWFLSLELDLLTSAGFSKTCASPPPASSGPAASSHGHASSPCLARGLHAPGRSLPRLTHVGHGLSSRARLGVFRWIRGLLAYFCCRGGLWWTRAIDGVTRFRSRFWLLFRVFYVVFFFSFLFTVCVCDV
jgi:hypothetical protein